MLKKVVEQLAEKPHLLEQLKEDKLKAAGISETEKAAVVDVLTDKEFQGINVNKSYWK
ncbi:competence pheromone ComX [Salibacterium aidingense]|uniref:competence pheromone ComX n=1 Tax=Salibacterium aidingense TaxID=384933 RepID=UPI000419A3E3|nr:competence pheromone ComX [Salibacterium aidingense]